VFGITPVFERNLNKSGKQRISIQLPQIARVHLAAEVESGWLRLEAPLYYWNAMSSGPVQI
jgi:hypothetical protein